ncbi:MAG: adenosylcobinamide amidohydrolase [Dehalococcoides mccartyi]|uniref:adenosylcobinamide amidohydrolase n=1 Tax=Dehalococcoides mccartyi TaxID=61435 RepID=UPI0030FA887D
MQLKNTGYSPVTLEREVCSLPGVKAEVFSTRVWDAPANLLAVFFDENHAALSGTDGYGSIRLVCNCYLPKDLCDYLHFNHKDYDDYLKDLKQEMASFYSLETQEIFMLSTGVSMDEVCYTLESGDKLWVCAWVTAGFKHNAMRIGVDKGAGLEVEGECQPCGTINIITATNARLDSAALASSFVTVTEAKVVALQDLNIHSSFNPALQATGTGTDQIVAVSGRDFGCRYVGGHTRLGEMTARAVTSTCRKALSIQLAKDPNYYSGGKK